MGRKRSEENERNRNVSMTCSPKNGSLDLAAPRQLCREGMLRPIDPIEAECERIACGAGLHIQALTALAEMLQALPRVAGSAA